ncbi:MAG TPA: extracellular solute-binding protein [Hyphomicrobiaceae bacterium]|nr:extracellular solute-binding protein [Hyphomicrobiaceae bacterium]
MRMMARALALGAALSMSPAAAQSVHVAVAGDHNMVDYFNTVLAPKFEQANGGVKVFVLGTAPGDAGSQKIYEKLSAQKAAGIERWDFDVIVIDQKTAGRMVQENLLAAYRDNITTGALVAHDTASIALGMDVSGFVMPMFHAQTAIAYNSGQVPDVPGSYAQLEAWVKQNPNKFGYSGIKRGMSGIGFVAGWVYAFAGDREKLIRGPYDPLTKAAWDKPLDQLREFNKNVVITPSDAATLDQLGRGEIAMGPVWADLFYTRKSQGQLSPDMRLKLLAPGMPSQAMYYAIPAKAANAKNAEKFVALATSPKEQAEGVVKRFHWYPGIDARHLEGTLDAATWNQFFSDVTPDDLAAKRKPFPLGQYLTDILESYQKKIEN